MAIAFVPGAIRIHVQPAGEGGKVVDPTHKGLVAA